MKIGKPKRIYRVEPLYDPVPASPTPERPERRAEPEQPAPVSAP